MHTPQNLGPQKIDPGLVAIRPAGVRLMMEPGFAAPALAAQRSAAATFFARAGQLSLQPPTTRVEERERRRRRRRSGERNRLGISGRKESRGLPTDYRAALSKFSPTIPNALVRKIGTRDVQGLGKVRVVLRVSPRIPLSEGESSVLTLDKRRRQVTLVEAPQGRPAHERVGVAAPKMFAFDQVYTQDEPQNEVVSGAVVDVLHAVLAGNDGCVLSFGGSGLGKTYTMLGSHTGPGQLGVIPAGVAWLYRAIVEQKAKSGARFSVRVSAVAVDATGGHLTDLLAEFAQEGEASPGALLRDSTGGYLSSVAELRAPSPETAAHYLDVAIANRATIPIQTSSGQQTQGHQSTSSATLLYTLHLYQYAVDKSGKGGVVGGRSRLHMIDVGDLTGSRGGLSLSALTSVLLAIFNGQRYLPHRDNRLTTLLQEVLGSVTCHAAMVVHVSPSSRHTQHTLATLQLAARVHRMRRKKLRGMGSSGSGGSSEGSQGRSSSEASATSSSLDFSSSELSCDTVIYLGDTTDNEHPPIFLPHQINPANRPSSQNSSQNFNPSQFSSQNSMMNSAKCPLVRVKLERSVSASPTPPKGVVEMDLRRAASASPTPLRGYIHGNTHVGILRTHEGGNIHGGFINAGNAGQFGHGNISGNVMHMQGQFVQPGNVHNTLPGGMHMSGMAQGGAQGPGNAHTQGSARNTHRPTGNVQGFVRHQPGVSKISYNTEGHNKKLTLDSLKRPLMPSSDPQKRLMYSSEHQKRPSLDQEKCPVVAPNSAEPKRPLRSSSAELKQPLRSSSAELKRPVSAPRPTSEQHKRPFLSSFKPQVALGPLVPGDLRHYNYKENVQHFNAAGNVAAHSSYNAYEEPNNLVPIFQNQNPDFVKNQRIQAQKMQSQNFSVSQNQNYQGQNPLLVTQNPKMLVQNLAQNQNYQGQNPLSLTQNVGLSLAQNVSLSQTQNYIIQNTQTKNFYLIQNAPSQNLAQNASKKLLLAQNPKRKHMEESRGLTAPLQHEYYTRRSDEQWIDGPRVQKSKLGLGKCPKGETWIDGPGRDGVKGGKIGETSGGAGRKVGGKVGGLEVKSQTVGAKGVTERNMQVTPQLHGAENVGNMPDSSMENDRNLQSMSGVENQRNLQASSEIERMDITEQVSVPNSSAAENQKTNIALENQRNILNQQGNIAENQGTIPGSMQANPEGLNAGNERMEMSFSGSTNQGAGLGQSFPHTVTGPASQAAAPGSALSYGFMDDHKKTMIERWVAVQTAQVVQRLEKDNTDCPPIPDTSTPTTTTTDSVKLDSYPHLNRACEDSTIDSDQDTLSEDPPIVAKEPSAQPSLIEQLERKNLIPSHSPTHPVPPHQGHSPMHPPHPPSHSPTHPSDTDPSRHSPTHPSDTPSRTSHQESSGPGVVTDEPGSGVGSVNDVFDAAPSIDEICSQCEALAEECEELSSLLSCEEEECKRQAHLGLATVLEEPELEVETLPRRGNIDEEECSCLGEDKGERDRHMRISMASTFTNQSGELIEVTVPDYPIITVDCCIQVCEEDILRNLSNTPCPSEVMSVQTSDDHPLRVLSEENLTCASTFTDSYSQIGETGDESDSEDEDSRPFSLFEVTDYGRLCEDLSIAFQSDMANRNLHELAKIHELYRTLARQSPRVHVEKPSIQNPKLQAATLAEILNGRPNWLPDTQANESRATQNLHRTPTTLEAASVCSEPAMNMKRLCGNCHKFRLRHSDSILKFESALRSKSEWLFKGLGGGQIEGEETGGVEEKYGESGGVGKRFGGKNEGNTERFGANAELIEANRGEIGENGERIGDVNSLSENEDDLCTCDVQSDLVPYMPSNYFDIMDRGREYFNLTDRDFSRVDRDFNRIDGGYFDLTDERYLDYVDIDHFDLTDRGEGAFLDKTDRDFDLTDSGETEHFLYNEQFFRIADRQENDYFENTDMPQNFRLPENADHFFRITGSENSEQTERFHRTDPLHRTENYNILESQNMGQNLASEDGNFNKPDYQYTPENSHRTESFETLENLHMSENFNDIRDSCGDIVKNLSPESANITDDRTLITDSCSDEKTLVGDESDCLSTISEDSTYATPSKLSKFLCVGVRTKKTPYKMKDKNKSLETKHKTSDKSKSLSKSSDGKSEKDLRTKGKFLETKPVQNEILETKQMTSKGLENKILENERKTLDIESIDNKNTGVGTSTETIEKLSLETTESKESLESLESKILQSKHTEEPIGKKIEHVQTENKLQIYNSKNVNRSPSLNKNNRNRSPANNLLNRNNSPLNRNPLHRNRSKSPLNRNNNPLNRNPLRNRSKSPVNKNPLSRSPLNRNRSPVNKNSLNKSPVKGRWGKGARISALSSIGKPSIKGFKLSSFEKPSEPSEKKAGSLSPSKEPSKKPIRPVSFAGKPSDPPKGLCFPQKCASEEYDSGHEGCLTPQGPMPAKSLKNIPTVSKDSPQLPSPSKVVYTNSKNILAISKNSSGNSKYSKNIPQNFDKELRSPMKTGQNFDKMPQKTPSHSSIDSKAVQNSELVPTKSMENSPKLAKGAQNYSNTSTLIAESCSNINLGTNPSLGESSGYESIPECSSFSSSQDEEDGRKEGEKDDSSTVTHTHQKVEEDPDHPSSPSYVAHSPTTSSHPSTPSRTRIPYPIIERRTHLPTPSKPSTPSPTRGPGSTHTPSTMKIENWTEEEIQRYEGRPKSSEIPEMRNKRQEILSLRSTQEVLKYDFKQAKTQLNIPKDSWSYELHVKEDSNIDHTTLVEAMARETIILKKRVCAAKSRILMATSFTSTSQNNKKETYIE